MLPGIHVLYRYKYLVTTLMLTYRRLHVKPPLNLAVSLMRDSIARNPASSRATPYEPHHRYIPHTRATAGWHNTLRSHLGEEEEGSRVKRSLQARAAVCSPAGPLLHTYAITDGTS